jgi:glycosyltransferase involved in cell wall biosynthesis
MKILLMIRRLDFGGAENYVVDLANILTKFGHEVFVLAKPGRRVALLEPSVVYIPTKFGRYFKLPLIIKLKRIIKKNNIEIMHCNQSTPIIHGAILRKLTKIPLIATLHGKAQIDLPSSFVREQIGKLIVINSFFLDLITNYAPELALKTVLIPNGIDCGKISKYQLNDSEFQVLYASRLDRHHAKVVRMLILDIFPKLYKETPKIRLLIAGDGENFTELNRLAKKINQKLNKDFITLVGYKEDIKPLINQSHLVLGVGRVALETLGQGVPLIAVNHKYLSGPVSIDNFQNMCNNNFLVKTKPAPESKEFIKIIREFMKNYNYWLNEADKIQREVMDEYNLTKVANQIIRLYQETIISSRGSLQDSSVSGKRAINQ